MAKPNVQPTTAILVHKKARACRGSVPRRSKHASCKRLERYHASGASARAQARLEAMTVRRRIPFDDFARFLPQNGQRLREEAARRGYSNEATHYPMAPRYGRYLVYETILMPSPEKPLYMDLLLGRFDNFIPERTYRKLFLAAERIITLQVKHSISQHSDANRSTIPAVHLGVWETYSMTPRITKESQIQSSTVEEAMEYLWHTLRTDLASKLVRLMQMLAPRAFKRMQNAVRRAREQGLYQDLPDMDCYGAFMAVALKEGSSEILHVDWNDPNDGHPTWVLPLGPFEGGHLTAPQLGVQVPIQPRQVLVFQARRILHYTAPVTSGKRYVLTLFTDRFLLAHANA